MLFFKRLLQRIGLPLLLFGFITPFGVRAQPVIFVQPIGQEVGIGTDVTFRVGARAGTPLPLRYQWRLNGELLKGATNATLTVSNVQPRNAGSYSVTVADRGGSVNSAVARLTLTLPVLPFADDFNSRTNQIVALAGVGRGNNANASREKGEPLHAGKRGTHSVWLTWRPLADGIANFSTAGSGFDTLLAVYTGANLTNLTEVEANEDQGGFHTSSVQFNATAGTVYHIAVDGRGSAAGEIVLLWHLEVTGELLPSITAEPLNTIGAVGDRITLVVRLDTVTDTGIQWLFNGQEISAATSNVLDVGDLQRTKVGKYVARIRKGTREILSEPVEIQIHVRGDGRIDPNVRAGDRFNDVADLIASSALQPQDIQPSRVQLAASAPARGFSGTQIFSTFGATKEEGEPNHCGEPGGASEWYAYQAEADGILTIDTDGSDFDTVLAVYTGPGTDFDSLVEVACDKDSGQDGQDSKVSFAVKTGTIYFIAVDGVDGASGTVTLNYSLLVPPRISAIPDQTTDEDAPTGTINFTVDSANPQATNFTFAASSSNTNLVPNENIFFGAGTTNHTIRIIPATNQFGTATITIIASDGTASASRSFAVIVKAVNDAPTISDLVSEFTTIIGGSSAKIPFTVNDVETPSANLMVSAVSSATNLLSIVDIVTENSGTNRVLIIQPHAVPPCNGGVATMTLTVEDSDGGTINRNFIVNVTVPQGTVTISPVPDQTIKENTSTAPLLFLVIGTFPQDTNLVVVATASNTNLVPNESILIAGTGTSRTLTITPAANQTGSTVITVTVVDECGSSASSSFTLTVIPSNTPPTISLPGSSWILPLNSTSGSIPFTVSDLETPANALVITANSSNTNFVPNTSFVFGGSGTNRTVTFTIATNYASCTRITIAATDTDGGTAGAWLIFINNLGPSAPFISPIPDRGIPAKAPPLTISVAADDCETPADFLMVSGTSSNPALVPDANIVISGSGTNRMMTITPATNQTGTTTITVTVRDTDGNTTSTSFVLTVLPEIRLHAKGILVGGALQLRLTGFTGQGALIQSSTDLKSWQSIYTNTAPDGQLPPLDFKTAGQPRQFFRALFSR